MENEDIRGAESTLKGNNLSKSNHIVFSKEIKEDKSGKFYCHEKIHKRTQIFIEPQSHLHKKKKSRDRDKEKVRLNLFLE